MPEPGVTTEYESRYPAMPDRIEVNSYTSAAQFVENLRGSHARWGGGLEMPWIFRGQSAHWDLTPSAFRPHGKKILAAITSRYPPLSDESWDSARRLLPPLIRKISDATVRERYLVAYYQTAAEFEAVAQFAGFADRLAIRLPPAPKPLRAINWAYDMFPGHDPDGPNDFPFDDAVISEAFGFAQHHGIPTRLLDWTDNPMFAAYFAVGQEAEIDNELAVYAVNLNLMPDKGRLKALRCERATHTFLHAQSGLFLYNPDAHLDFIRTGDWETIDSIIQSEFVGDSPALIKLTLAAGERPALQKILWREHISRAHLMPTLDNVSRALQEKWRLRVDRGPG